MAPKKTIKGKVVAEEPTQEDGWNTSKCSQSDLESLVKQGLMAPGSVVQWRPALGKDHPYEKYGGSCCFLLILGTGIAVSLLFFLFWAPRLLQDPVASSDPQFLCSYFYLRAFVRSFPGHRAPFRAFPILFPFEASTRLLRLRYSRRCGSPT